MSWLIGLQVNLPLSSDDFPSLEPTEIFLLMFPSGICPRFLNTILDVGPMEKLQRLHLKGGFFRGHEIGLMKGGDWRLSRVSLRQVFAQIDTLREEVSW